MAILHVWGYNNNKIILVHNLKWQFIRLNRLDRWWKPKFALGYSLEAFIHAFVIPGKSRRGIVTFAESKYWGLFCVKCSFMQRCRSVKLIRIRGIEEAEGPRSDVWLLSFKHFMNELVIHKILQLAVVRATAVQVEARFVNKPSIFSLLTHCWLDLTILKPYLYVIK